MYPNRNSIDKQKKNRTTIGPESPITTGPFQGRPRGMFWGLGLIGLKRILFARNLPRLERDNLVCAYDSLASGVPYLNTFFIGPVPLRNHCEIKVCPFFSLETSKSSSGAPSLGPEFLQSSSPEHQEAAQGIYSRALWGFTGFGV